MLNRITVLEAQHAPAAALYEYADAAGNTYQHTEASAAKHRGLTRTSDTPLPVGSGRGQVTYDVSGFGEARLVGDASDA